MKFTDIKSVIEGNDFEFNSPIMRALCYKYYKKEKEFNPNGSIVEDVKHRFFNDLIELIEKNEDLNYRVKYRPEYEVDPKILRLVNGLLLLYIYAGGIGKWNWNKNLLHPSFKRVANLIEEFMCDILCRLVDTKFEIVYTCRTLAGIDFIAYNQTDGYWPVGFQIKTTAVCQWKEETSFDLLKKLQASKLANRARKLKEDFPNKKIYLFLPQVELWGSKGQTRLNQLEEAWNDVGGVIYFWRWSEEEGFYTMELHNLKNNRINQILHTSVPIR